MPVSFDQFAAAVEANGLVPDEELRAAVEQLRSSGLRDVQELARTLVLSGKLTKYQAQQVYAGKGKELVFGQYVVLDRLGQGGMGQVFKAQHRVMQRVVALKVLSPAAMKSPDAVQRFRREVRAAARLNHPHIVTAFDADQAGGTHYLVMECVEGQDLESLCRQNGRLPIPEAISYTLQTATGLAYAHAQGVIHRDIKPHNLLLDKTGTVKILDMGLARLLDGSDTASLEGLTQSGVVMGTVDYMAPEQAEDTHHADARADIYSLGCTLFRLLAGRTPYAGETVVAKLMGHANKPVPALRDERGDVSQELSDVVQRMMAKRAEDRYQNSEELAVDLRACAAGMKPAAARATAATIVRDDQLSDFLAGLSPTAAPAAAPTRVNALATAETKRPASSRSETITATPRAGPSGRISQMRAERPAVLYGSLGAAGLIAGLLLVMFWPGGEKTATTGSASTPVIPDNQASTSAEPPVQPLATKPPPVDAEADAALKSLAARIRQSSGDLAPLAEELQTILLNHTGTSTATRASELLTAFLARSASPLDLLKAADLPADALEYWRAVLDKPLPQELVAVVGDHRARQFGSVYALAASGDGKWLASAGAFGQVYLWDASTWRLARVLTRPPRIPVRAVAFAPSGKQLAAAGDDHKIQLWDLETQEPPRVLEGHKAAVTSLAYTSDGQWLVSAGGVDGTLRVSDAVTGEVRRYFVEHAEPVHRVVAIPGTSHVVSSGQSGKTLRWDTLTGMRVARVQHPASANALAVSADGATLLTAGANGQFVHWDSTTGNELGRLDGHERMIKNVAFLPGGRAASCSDDGTVRIWDLKTYQQLHVARGHLGELHGLCVLPDRPILATSADDSVIRFWSAETLEEVDPPAGHVGPIRSLTFTRSSNTLITRGQDRTLRTWYLNASPAREAAKNVDVNVLDRDNCLTLYRNGRTLAYNLHADTVRLDDFSSPQISSGPEFQVPGRVTALAWSPTRNQLAVAVLEETGTGFVQLWQPQKERPTRTNTFGREVGAISSLCYSPDGLRLASARVTGTLTVWDLGTISKRQEYPGAWPATNVSPCTVQFSPDGTLLAFTEPGFVRLLRAANGQKVFERNQGTGNVVATSGAFTPDGQYFICGGFYLMNGWVHCIDARQALETHYFNLPAPVNSVSVALDGRHFATADGNGTVYVFRLGDRGE